MQKYSATKSQQLNPSTDSITSLLKNRPTQALTVSKVCLKTAFVSQGRVHFPSADHQSIWDSYTYRTPIGTPPPTHPSKKTTSCLTQAIKVSQQSQKDFGFTVLKKYPQAGFHFFTEVTPGTVYRMSKSN